jgi:ribosomal-protein-alanine N-acetyltransferase
MELVTPRLILRDFTPEDLPALRASHADPRRAEFSGPRESGSEFAHALLTRFLVWSAEWPRQNDQLAIVERGEGEGLIGSCGIRLQGCEPGRGEFGLELAPERWGRGLATEAARAILRFAFHDLGLREVRGVTVTENARVQRLLARLGFIQAETRPGPAWMQARGWSQTEWRLIAAPSGPDGSRRFLLSFFL